MGMNATDALSATLAQIELWAKDNGLQLVPAWVEAGDAIPTVHWKSDEDGGGWQSCLAQAKAMGAPVIMLSVLPLTQEGWDDQLETAQQLEDDERVARVHDLDECKPYIGHIMHLDLRWFTASVPGVVFAWGGHAQWLDVFYGPDDEQSVRTRTTSRPNLTEAAITALATKLAADLDFERFAGTREGLGVAERLFPKEMAEIGVSYAVLTRAETVIKERLEKDPEVKRLADQLARDGRFQKATTAKMRRYATEKILDPALAEHPMKLGLVIELARAIYETELKGRGSTH